MSRAPRRPESPPVAADALAWERVYNTVRPHQALGYKTPKQFLEELPDLSGRPP